MCFHLTPPNRVSCQLVGVALPYPCIHMCNHCQLILPCAIQVAVNLAEVTEEDQFIMVPYLSSLDFFLTPSRVMQGHNSVCSTLTAGTATTRDTFELKVCACVHVCVCVPML